MTHLRLTSLMFIVVFTTSCGANTARRHDLNSDENDAGDAVPDAGGDGPIIDTDGGTCHEGTPPAGKQCACAFSDCPGCSIRCLCNIDCYEERDDCLVIVKDGVITTSDPVLSAWDVSCERQNPGGEAAYMVCDARKNPCVTDPDAGPPDAGEDGGNDAGEDGSTDGGTDPKCPVPVPGKFTLVEPVWAEFGVNYHIPFKPYAFAVAHAWRGLEQSTFGLRLRPSLFLATALKESFMGCSNKLQPWEPGLEGIVYRGEAQHVDIDGCFQFESATAWVEMCRMFDDDLDCTLGHPALISSANQDVLGRDNFVASAMTAAYYHMFSFSFFQLKENIKDPFTWLNSASDPHATAKVAAALYNRGAWGGVASRVFAACHDRLIEECEPGALDYVRQVGAYMREMEAEISAENCYDEVITLEDIDGYLSQILPLFGDKNETALRAAAHSAFFAVTGGAPASTFQRVALQVIDAIEAKIPAKLHCPEDELNEFYVQWGTPRWLCPG